MRVVRFYVSCFLLLFLLLLLLLVFLVLNCDDACSVFHAGPQPCCIAVALVALVLGSGGRRCWLSNLQILGVQADRIERLLIRSWVSKLTDFGGFSAVRFGGFEGASVVRLWGFKLADFEGSSFVRFWGCKLMNYIRFLYVSFVFRFWGFKLIDFNWQFFVVFVCSFKLVDCECFSFVR